MVICCSDAPHALENHERKSLLAELIEIDAIAVQKNRDAVSRVPVERI